MKRWRQHSTTLLYGFEGCGSTEPEVLWSVDLLYGYLDPRIRYSR